MRGYFGIGIYQFKKEVNVGTLWRHAMIMGADFIFTIGRKYSHQSSDTLKAPRHIPMFSHETFDGFLQHGVPEGCRIVGVEMDNRSACIHNYTHPQSCVYLLGAEDCGLPEKVLGRCNDIVQLPGKFSMNVSTAGSIVMYDRMCKKLEKK